MPFSVILKGILVLLPCHIFSKAPTRSGVVFFIGLFTLDSFFGLCAFFNRLAFFFILLPCRFCRSTAGWGFVVSGIEAGAFEDDFGWSDNFLKRLLAAFRAGFQRRIAEGLMTFELHSTRFAPISINWHRLFSFFPC